MNLNKTQLGSAIRSHRISLGYTQEYLAEQIDITVTHMKHLESGHRLPSIEVLYRLVQILHLSLDKLWIPASVTTTDAENELSLLLSHCSENELLILTDLAKSLLKNNK